MPDVEEVTDESTGSTDDAPDEVVSRLDRVESVLGELGEFIRGGVGSVLSGVDADESPDHVDDEEAEVTATDTPKSPRQVEQDTAALVRAELAKIHKEEETDERLSKVEAKVAEKPPEQLSRWKKAIWG